METKDKKPRRPLTIIEIMLICLMVFFVGVIASESLTDEVTEMICGGIE